VILKFTHTARRTTADPGNHGSERNLAPKRIPGAIASKILRIPNNVLRFQDGEDLLQNYITVGGSCPIASFLRTTASTSMRVSSGIWLAENMTINISGRHLLIAAATLWPLILGMW
jgi:hypothetical protein